MLGLIALVWFLIKALEIALPQTLIDRLPVSVHLSLLALIILIVIFHNNYTFIAQFHHRRNPRPVSDSYRPSVDIFISAHNEEAVIGETVTRLLEQDYEGLNIYVVNDRSTDQTIEILRKKEIEAKKLREKNPKIPQLVIIDRPRDAFPGKSAALNDALKASQGEVICTLDADARIDRDFLEKIVKQLNDPLVAAVQAQKVISNPEKNFLTRAQYYEYAMDTYLQVGRDSIRGTVELRGNGQLVKRKALEHVGGWNEETLTDDLDLSTCLHVNGWDIRFSAEDKVYEEAVPEWNALIKQRRRWAEGSLRRYFTYFFQLTQPGNLSFNQIIDTFAFMTQFGVPLWLSFEVIFEIIKYSSGGEAHFTTLMFLSSMMSFIILSNQFHGLRIYKKQRFFEAIKNTITNTAYFFSIWMLVVFISYRKVIFSRTMGTWQRTEHGNSN